MGTKNEAQRQKLVAAIENGRYKTGRGSDYKIAIMVIVTLFIFAYITTILSAFSSKSDAPLGVVIFCLFIMTLPLLAILILANVGKGINLGKLSPLQRWLILNGEAIEADVDSIDEKSSTLFSISCSADYSGQKLHFVSPAFGVRPIPFEERKITVYLNPQNPQQYVVDIYSHLPLAGDNVLHDRSEMQVSLDRKTPNQTSTTALLVLCIAFFCPMAFFGMVVGIGSALSGETASGVVMAIMCPIIAALAIFGMVEYAKRNKNLTEKGYYIPATAQRFWITRSKNSTTYHLSARYIEPSTKQVHEFHTTGPSAMRDLVGTKVDVFINPDNTKEFFIDTKTALKRLGFTTSRESGK